MHQRRQLVLIDDGHRRPVFSSPPSGSLRRQETDAPSFNNQAQHFCHLRFKACPGILVVNCSRRNIFVIRHHVLVSCETTRRDVTEKV